MLIRLENGRRLFMECAGKGAPTVLLEAGAGSASGTWNPIWPGIASMTRVCRYDRAGLGQSDPAPGPRTAADVADELHRLLTAASVPGPYILVGHSFGGLVVRLFADRHREQVAGAVLVDSSHPEQSSRGLRLLPRPLAGEPPSVTGLRARYSDPDAMLSEGINFGRSLAQAGETRPLGKVPLVVLTRSFPATAEELERVRPGLPLETGTALEHLWQAMQKELAGLSASSRHLVAQRSGHYIHHDQPGLVVRAIHAVISAARGER